jgi:hypothetical protein
MRERAEVYIDPKIAPSDADTIRLVIQNLPNVDQRIISMQLEKNGTVRVRTGVIWGPRAGHGQFVTLERNAVHWRVVSVGGWIA